MNRRLIIKQIAIAWEGMKEADCNSYAMKCIWTINPKHSVREDQHVEQSSPSPAALLLLPFPTFLPSYLPSFPPSRGIDGMSGGIGESPGEGTFVGIRGMTRDAHIEGCRV